MEDRIKRVAERRELTPEKAKDYIQKAEKQRASYYNYYTTKKWGATTSYNYCLDTSVLGIDGTVELIKHIIDHI